MSNTIELGRAIKDRRTQLGWSLRAVGDATGVSSSTLSRIENGLGKPDADNIAAISRWLDMPADRFIEGVTKDVEPVIYYPHEATPDIVRAHLLADKNLDKETANALSELFNVAYRQFARKEAGK